MNGLIKRLSHEAIALGDEMTYEEEEYKIEFDKWVKEIKPELPSDFKNQWMPAVLKELRVHYKIEPDTKRISLANYIWHQYNDGHRNGYFGLVFKLKRKKVSHDTAKD